MTLYKQFLILFILLIFTGCYEKPLPQNNSIEMNTIVGEWKVINGDKRFNLETIDIDDATEYILKVYEKNKSPQLYSFRIYPLSKESYFITEVKVMINFKAQKFNDNKNITKNSNGYLRYIIKLVSKDEIHLFSIKNKVENKYFLKYVNDNLINFTDNKKFVVFKRVNK